MMLRHPMRLVLAPAVGLVILLAASSEAATVNAATFLAGCPGPIFIATDTTLTGSAVVSGDCTLGTVGTPQINFDRANLSFGGAFEVTGNASSMMVARSAIIAGTDLTLDSEGPMTIKGSKLTAKAGTIDLPPRGDLMIIGSSLVAQGDAALSKGNVVLGGPGGLREVTGSALRATGAITIAPAFFPAAAPINLIRSTLSATTRLSVGGLPSAISIDASTLEALGAGASVRVMPGTDTVATISGGSKLKAPAGSIIVDGRASFIVEDAKFFSGGPGMIPDVSFTAGIIVGGRSSTYRRTQLTATGSGIVVTNGFTDDITPPPLFEDCQFLGVGEYNANGPGTGILFGANRVPSISGTLIQAPSGGIRIVGAGELSIVGSSLQARHASGIAIGTHEDRTIADSRLDSPLGPIAIRGVGLTEIGGSRLTAMNAGGILLSGGTSAVESSVVATRGSLTIQNFGSEVATSSIKADAGLLTETSGGGNSVLTASGVRSASIVIRSFDDTIVTDNNLAAAAYEFSAAGTCTSSGNTPNIPCL